MKKIKFAKKSRKLFSAILAGVMLTTSVIPESFVWASEEVQEFGDSESLGFGSTSDPMSGAGEDGKDQALSDFQDMPDVQNGNDTVDMESGFTDESDSFGSNGRDSSVGSDFQSLASVEELQERINALPTVEEFQNLADGTTVEGSTLNQAQTDVYAEAQDIAEKLDLLSEEEQGLVDVSRLEALFGYFNGMTEVLADTPTPIGPVTSGSVTIDHGGTYIIQGGIYTTGKTPIIIKTSEDVTLNIVGNIEMTRARCFIIVENGSQNVTICNDKYTVNTDAGSVLINKGNTSTVTFKGGIYTKASGGSEYKYYSDYMIFNRGTVKFYDVTLKTTGNGGAGTIVDNKNGTVNIYAGTTIDGGAKNINRPYAVIEGNIYMEGGTITSQSGEYNGIFGNNVKMVGGIIKNCQHAIMGYKSENIVLGSYATFENNSADIMLHFEQIFTIQDDFKGNASVFIGEDNPSFPRRITTSGISKSMLGRITSVNGYSVNYAEDDNGGYLYLWEHTHKWNYSSNGNKIIAKCSGSECGNELELSLTAEDSVYSGEAYNGAKIENNISYVTGKKADIVYYLEGGKTKTNASNSGAAGEGAAPVNAGKYVVKVSVGGKTISAGFEITKLQITSVKFNNWEYGQSENIPDVTLLSGENDITSLLNNDSNITYEYYTDADCVTKTTKEKDGASENGGIPKNAGTYYVRATVAGNKNYAAGITEAVQFMIARKSVVASVSAEDKTYDGSNSAAVSATVKQNELVSGDSITITNLIGTFENQNAGINKKVTVHSSADSISGIGAENYDVQIAPETTASINKRIAVLTWGNTDLTYTGTEQSVTATVKKAVSVDTFNITYKGNTQTEVGDSYTATVTDLGNDNYTLTGATGVSQNWSISYLQTSAVAQVSGTKGNNDWYISPVKLVPDSGYQISTDKTDWKDSLGDYVTQRSNTVEYYLKEKATGFVTDKKTATFKIDTEAPTGKIEIGTNSFSSFLNSVTYGYWFRDNAAVDITGADSTSGIASIKYQKVKADEPYDENGTWLPWNAATKLSLTESGKYVIYARITDNAGNQTIINSDGVVVFKDSVVADSSIDYTRTTKTSVDAKVTLNGNTVASVKNAQNTLKAGTDYTVYADKITFSGEYLDTLAVGTYTLTVAYHPQGEIQYTGGDKPAESQIALKVKQKTVNVTYQTANVKITSVLDKEYDGQPADLVYTTNSTASVKVEYNVNGIWQTKAPTYAGTYEVKVSVPGNSYFTAASTTKTYTIKPRGMEISGITANKKVYDGTKNAELDYSKVVFARLIEGDALTVSAEGTFADSNAAKGKTVTITNLVLGGRSASNYVLTADGQQAGTIADINPKRITVTADNLKKIVGGADPVLTYTASGLVGEDTLSGIVVKRKAGEKVGTYAIKVSQKKGSNPNYRITFKKGIFTIQQADQSKLKGKDIYRLKLPVFFAKGKANKNSISLSWKKYAGATGYDVYWSYCDGRINYKKVGTVKSGKLSMSHKKLKKDHEYKYFIAAYKMVEGRKIYIARSNDVHVALKQASTTNAASIKVNRTEITLSVGKTFQLKCSLKAEDSSKDLVSHTSPFRYYTTNSKVATVNKDGVIKAKGKGVCTIYILANNGVYKKVTVTVK